MMLLSPRVLQRSAKHSLVMRKSVRGMHKGERRSSKQGTSLEFSDFRTYVPGDDPRLIDWNAFARTQKHYIKRYLDEQELFVTIYLDCSNSMMIPAGKWETARSLAACLGYMSLVHDDRVSVYPAGSGSPSFLHKKGRAFAGRLLTYLAELKISTGSEKFWTRLAEIQQKRNGLSIIISDLLEPVDDIKEALKRMQASRQEIRIIQVLSTDELEPSYQGDLKLVDSESKELREVSISRKVLQEYDERLQAHNDELEKFCRERGIGYLQCSSGQSLEELVFSSMAAKGWVM
ncbi:DUF58 domain-containing protein [Rossellomorea vietnamensis]|uniref:DUF58 domain-containing protein n=1 Tax=Rossellomorea vietnamensis TaxID=218284 RepID=A0A5D4MHK2_9BACI|nr:DUF58 domain-containing protein [Rossellomorea vietnamensis]TYS01122.1 DUF58 domain-containing protein [Rossellomorea vietnamensis]